MAGEKLKSVCSQCNVNKWVVDFKEGNYSKISVRSVCLSCEQAALIEEQKKEIEILKKKDQEKEERIRKLEDYVSKIEKLTLKKGEQAKSEEPIIDKSSSIKDVKEVEKEVKELSKIVKENRDEIVDTGKQVVEIREEIASFKESRDFQVVRGKKSTKSNDKKPGITVSNRFTPLADEADTPETEAYVFGDSIVREQAYHFALKNKRQNKQRKVLSYSGCKAKKVLDEVIALKVKNNNTCIIANAGGNDLFLRGNKIGNTEPLRVDLESLVDTISKKTGKGILIGIMPRIYTSYCAMSKAIGLNMRMDKYCSKTNVEFIDVWDTFANKRQYFKRDGVHLNEAGHKKLGEIIGQTYDKVKNKAKPSHKIPESSSSQDLVCITQEPSPTQVQESLEENIFEGFPNL